MVSRKYAPKISLFDRPHTVIHFQHVKTSGRAVQTPIPAKLMRETVTEMIIALKT